jgi:hypothetical protein
MLNKTMLGLDLSCVSLLGAWLLGRRSTTRTTSKERKREKEDREINFPFDGEWVMEGRRKKLGSVEDGLVGPAADRVA